MTPQFSKAATTYNQYARIQQHVGTRLLEHISDNTYTSILDCGCGTGSLTKQVANHYPKASITGFDKEAAMIKYAKSQHETSFIEADLTTYTAPAPVDLLISNATFQWVDSLDLITQFLTRNTHAQSTVACTIFGPQTFIELQHLVPHIPAASFFDMPQYTAQFEQNFQITYADNSTYHSSFESLADLLKSIKLTGTSAKNTHIWTRSKLEKLEQNYTQRFGSITATFNVFTFILKRL